MKLPLIKKRLNTCVKANSTLSGVVFRVHDNLAGDNLLGPIRRQANLTEYNNDLPSPALK